MPIAYIWSISVTWLVASRPATKFLASPVAGRPQGSTPSIEGRRATTQMDASPYLLSHSEKIAALCAYGRGFRLSMRSRFNFRIDQNSEVCR